MIKATDVNALLKLMQQESRNDGGSFHFTRIDLPDGEDLVERLRGYFKQIKKYQDPFIFIDSTEPRRYLADLDVKNLEIHPDDHIEEWVDDKLRTWSFSPGSVTRKKTVTEKYADGEVAFKKAFFQFLEENDPVKAYILDGIDTYFAWGDHMNDDLIFETAAGVFVLHFGLSS